MEAYSSLWKPKTPFFRIHEAATRHLSGRLWSLVLGVSLVLGAWCLGFCIPPPLATRAISRHLPLAVSRDGGGERRIKALNGGQWRFKKSLEISQPRPREPK